jgi:hypothetical protein
MASFRIRNIKIVAAKNNYEQLWTVRNNWGHLGTVKAFGSFGAAYICSVINRWESKTEMFNRYIYFKSIYL